MTLYCPLCKATHTLTLIDVELLIYGLRAETLEARNGTSFINDDGENDCCLLDDLAYAKEPDGGFGEQTRGCLESRFLAEIEDWSVKT